MSLARWFPQPSPVLVAGRVVAVAELRVRDLATLTSYVAARLGPPYDDGLDGEGGDADYAASLSAAYDRIDQGWPPEIDAPEATDVLFGEPAGVAFFLAVALRGNGLSGDDLAAMAEAITTEELTAVERAAWGVGVDYKAECVRRIDKFLGLPEFAARPKPPSGERITWSKAVGEALDGDPSRLEAVGDMTLSQWRMFACGGEPEPVGDPLPADEALADEVCARRRKFFGLPDPPAPEPESPADPEAEPPSDPYPEPPE